jgi:hypothetical protein
MDAEGVQFGRQCGSVSTALKELADLACCPIHLIHGHSIKERQ